MFVGRAEASAPAGLVRAEQRADPGRQRRQGGLAWAACSSIMVDGRVRLGELDLPKREGEARRGAGMAQTVTGDDARWMRSVRGKVILVGWRRADRAASSRRACSHTKRRTRKKAIADLTTQADIMARASARRWTFEDPEAARDNLACWVRRASACAPVPAAALGSPLQRGRVGGGDRAQGPVRVRSEAAASSC